MQSSTYFVTNYMEEGKNIMGISMFVGVVLQIFVLVANSEILHRKALQQDNIIRADLPSQGVQLLQDDTHVVISNGLVSIRLTVPGGSVTNITYKGSDNLLFPENNEADRGHWDVVWNNTAHADQTDNFVGTSYKVIMQNENQTEISFTRTWTFNSTEAPLNVDKRYVMLKDSPGFYTYVVLERLPGWPVFYIQEGRVLFKLNENMFQYMAVSDSRQRFMPKVKDRENGKVLDYKEAVLLTNATNPAFNGEVDDKYLYTCDNKDIKVHGWVGSNPSLGFWMITPSNEFRTGGPLKQDLTPHLGPTVLHYFTSTHYSGEVLAIKFKTEEYWKKVIGPVYIYLNSNDSANADPSILWIDAKQRMQKEEASWPYEFPVSGDFVKSNQRGALSGQLLVCDWFVNKEAVPAGASAYVGLATPGKAGSWQYENKGYQFWNKTDENGSFSIKNVIPGNYSLFAWVPGFIGDYKHVSDITITPGSNIQATNVVFDAPRTGPTLWEIGIPDRSAAEFFIPNPDPTVKVHQYTKPVEKFRQYGLWAGYEEMYPRKDLVFTIGSSNYSKDWFFSQVTRNVGGEYVGTTWQILFDLKNVEKEGNYTLQLALASAHFAELQVRFNDRNSPPEFTTGTIGMDNALARHGIRGVYHYYGIPIPGSRLFVGRNTLFLTQARNLTKFREIMYDYIRLEGPPAIVH